MIKGYSTFIKGRILFIFQIKYAHQNNIFPLQINKSIFVYVLDF